MRAIARRQSATSFVPLLEIRDLERNGEEPIYAREFHQDFPDADAAIEYARGKGLQIIEDLIEVAPRN